MVQAMEIISLEQAYKLGCEHLGIGGQGGVSFQSSGKSEMVKHCVKIKS